MYLTIDTCQFFPNLFPCPRLTMHSCLVRRAFTVIFNDIKANTSRAPSLLGRKYINHSVQRTFTVAQNAPQNVTDNLLPQIFKYIDHHVRCYKSILKEAVAIRSISSDIKYRDDCVFMMEWMQDRLDEVGATTELRQVGFQVVDGQKVKLPPVLVGVLGNVSNTFFPVV